MPANILPFPSEYDKPEGAAVIPFPGQQAELVDLLAASHDGIAHTKLSVENIDEVDSLSRRERAVVWAKKHRTALLLGAAGVSAAVSFGMHPGETAHVVETKVPWAAGSMLVADGVNLAGIGIMGAAAGRDVDWKHFWRLRARLTEMAENANDSKAFNAGFWTSTAGGVGAFGVAAAAVLPNFPPEAWGMLAPFVADLGATVTSRVAVRQVIIHAAEKSTAE